MKLIHMKKYLKLPFLRLMSYFFSSLQVTILKKVGNALSPKLYATCTKRRVTMSVVVELKSSDDFFFLATGYAGYTDLISESVVSVKSVAINFENASGENNSAHIFPVNLFSFF